MPRADLDLHFVKIDQLILDIDAEIPAGTHYRAVSLRADLAGLLAVTIAATYETCVKQVIQGYAQGRHADFGTFARNNYDKINSRIRVDDLRTYCKVFGTPIKNRFNANLSLRKSKLLKRARKNIETNYEQILDWRHDFAHQWNRVATINEVVEAHRAAKRVIYVFDESFS